MGFSDSPVSSFLIVGIVLGFTSAHSHQTGNEQDYSISNSKANTVKEEDPRKMHLRCTLHMDKPRSPKH